MYCYNKKSTLDTVKREKERVRNGTKRETEIDAEGHRGTEREKPGTNRETEKEIGHLLRKKT